MTNITIVTDEGAKDIDMKKPRGKHMRKLLKYMVAFEKEEVAELEPYLDYLDSVTSELSGLSVEFLNEQMDVDEKTKLTEFVTSRAVDMMGFTKLSIPQASSVPKAKEV